MTCKVLRSSHDHVLDREDLRKYCVNSRVSFCIYAVSAIKVSNTSPQIIVILHPHSPKVKLDLSPDLKAPGPMLCRWAATTFISVAFEAPAAPC